MGIKIKIRHTHTFYDFECDVTVKWMWSGLISSWANIIFPPSESCSPSPPLQVLSNSAVACSKHTQIPCPDWKRPWQDHSSPVVYISEQKLSITQSKVRDTFFHQRSKWYWFLVSEGRWRCRPLRVCQTPAPKAYEIRCREQLSLNWRRSTECLQMWRKTLNLKTRDILLMLLCRWEKVREEW